MRRFPLRCNRVASGCLVTALLSCGAAHGQGSREHAIPSCYDQLREYAPHSMLGDLTVIIDQTTAIDARMRQIVRDTVDRLVKPGTSISIASFSAYLRGRYLDVLISGQVEPPVATQKRDFVSKRELRENDQCLSDQLTFARRLVAKTLDAAFAATDPNIVRSDILVALGDLSRRVGGANKGEGRMVIVVSDMLENSSITSFYHAGQMRHIDPDAELRRVAASGIKADFLGAKVYVIGAGGISKGPAHSYRDPRAMLALEDFWRRWFAKCRAELVEFGKPTPLVEIKWTVPGLMGMTEAKSRVRTDSRTATLALYTETSERRLFISVASRSDRRAGIA
jgi:hypothetical protein